MKRITAVAALLAVALSSCGAVHYTVKSVTGTLRTFDDARPPSDCSSPEMLVPVSVADSVWVRSEWWQSGSVIKVDSVRVQRVGDLTFNPPPYVPNATKVTTSIYLRDMGGTACVASLNQTPAQTLMKPATFGGFTVTP